MNYFVIFLCITGLLLVILSIMMTIKERKKTIIDKYIKGEKIKTSFLDRLFDDSKYISSFEEKISNKYAIVFDKIVPRTITKIIVLIMAIGIVFVLITKNIILLPIMVFIAYELPLLYLNVISKSKKNKIEEQLGISIKFLITEYTTTKSLVIAIQNIIPKLKNPIKKEYERLLRSINSGIDVKNALEDFSKRMNNKYARILACLINSFYEKGTEFTEQLMSISNDITDAQNEAKEGKAELTTVRWVNIIVNTVVFLTILIIFLFVPKFAICFQNTIRGQIFLVVAVMNSFISIILGLRLENK